MEDYLRQSNHAQEKLEQEKIALNLQLQAQQLELWALKNQQLLAKQTQQQQTTTIQTQQAEITQLENELKEKETEILRLNEELSTKIDDWVKKGTEIKQLEGKIAGMAEANEKNTQKNELLEHQINQLKEDLRKEKEAYLETKKDLQEEKDKLVVKRNEYDVLSRKLENKTQKWSGIHSTVRTKIADDVGKKWNTFKNWFS
ncbi:hypothetical protein [Candidatus Phytoplasma oryzae]|nr:hypothetical protein PIE28_01920 [Candidatus Phytoplasma oryzae]